MGSSGERLTPAGSVGAALSTLTDTLGDDFRLPGFLELLTGHCVDLLDAAGAGVMLADANGALRLLATSSADTRRLELIELDSGLGPCVDAYRKGQVITHHRFDPGGPRWAHLVTPARNAGFRSSHAITLRHGDQVFGVLNLFRGAAEPLPHGEQLLGRMLADVATMGLLRRRERQTGVDYGRRSRLRWLRPAIGGRIHESGS